MVVIFSLLTITLSRVLMSNSDKTKYSLCPALLSWQWQPVERWNEEIRTMKPLIVVSVDLKVKDITAQRERPL